MAPLLFRANALQLPGLLLFANNRYPHDEPLIVAHLQRAIANLEQIELVGTVERYEEWLRLAQSVLSRHFPKLALAVAYKNLDPRGRHFAVTATLDHLMQELGPSLSERLSNVIISICASNQAAEALLRQRLRDTDVDISLHSRYRAQCRS